VQRHRRERPESPTESCSPFVRLRITGRRIDAPGAPLKANVPNGYGSGFQATGLTFPTTGCWRVTGRFKRAQLTFTVLVTKSRLGP